MEHHPQSNEQVDKYDKTLVPGLRLYIDKHQADCDLFVQLSTYGYNTQVHITTQTSSFSHILS